VGSAGALVFALIALVALTSALAGSRFGEIVVLRALGAPPRMQASARFAELVVTVATAIVAGVVVGWLTASLTARELARASVAQAPDVLGVPLAFAWVPWLAGVAAFAVLATAIAAGAARAVRRLASHPGLREEER